MEIQLNSAETKDVCCLGCELAVADIWCQSFCGWFDRLFLTPVPSLTSTPLMTPFPGEGGRGWLELVQNRVAVVVKAVCLSESAFLPSFLSVCLSG